MLGGTIKCWALPPTVGRTLQDVEEHTVDMSLRDFLLRNLREFFSTGCKDVPPLGLDMSLAFLHNPEGNGLLSKFPKANTCSCKLSLPNC